MLGALFHEVANFYPFWPRDALAQSAKTNLTILLSVI